MKNREGNRFRARVIALAVLLGIASSVFGQPVLDQIHSPDISQGSSNGTVITNQGLQAQTFTVGKNG